MGGRQREKVLGVKGENSAPLPLGTSPAARAEQPNPFLTHLEREELEERAGGAGEGGEEGGQGLVQRRLEGRAGLGRRPPEPVPFRQHDRCRLVRHQLRPRAGRPHHQRPARPEHPGPEAERELRQHEDRQGGAQNGGERGPEAQLGGAAEPEDPTAVHLRHVPPSEAPPPPLAAPPRARSARRRSPTAGSASAAPPTWRSESVRPMDRLPGERKGGNGVAKRLLPRRGVGRRAQGAQG